MKEILWNKRSLNQVRSFPEEVRKKIGYLLYKLQMGDNLEMPNSKPMPTLAIGCYELRVSGDDGIYRAFYYLKLEERILIFHAFKKKTEKTSFIDLDQARKNLREMLNEEK